MNRRNLLKTVAVITTGVGLAGCSSEETRSEKIDRMFKIHQWLREGGGNWH